MRYIELNHYIKNGTETYPGMPPVEISTYMERNEDSLDTSLLDFLKMINISGTYLDAPYHVFEEGDKIGDIPLEKLVDLDTYVVHLAHDRNYFDVEDLRFIENENLAGSAVLLQSGHDRKFGTPEYGIAPPYLSVAGAKWLMEKEVVFVGIDSPLIDDLVHVPVHGTPVHQIILKASAIICEDMKDIDLVPDKGARLTAVPPRIAMSSFPARVFVKVDDGLFC